MIISIASGKGGTGKTTVAVNLALSIDNVQLIDCDVEEPNSALFLNPVLGVQKQAFIPIPVINKEQCNYCGMCREVCEYNAIAVMSQTDTSKGNIMILFRILTRLLLSLKWIACKVEGKSWQSHKSIYTYEPKATRWRVEWKHLAEQASGQETFPSYASAQAFMDAMNIGKDPIITRFCREES